MVNKKLKVLIADDSVVYRAQIRSALEAIPWIEISGVASNGRLAVDQMAINPSDLLILDLEMPVMDGIQTLQELRNRHSQAKVVVFSSISRRGAEITMEALKLGASDFVTKPGANGADGAEASSAVSPAMKIREALEPKISALFPELGSSSPTVTLRQETGVVRSPAFPKMTWDLFKPKIIVIGSSTGGPTVLESIFGDLRCSLTCPVVIAQHMPPVFTTTFAERLARISGMPAYEAQDGMVLQKNCIYLAPGDFHLRLKGSVQTTIASLDRGAHINSVRPAVDPLFSSAAEIFGNQCLAFILTGMGSDGKSGAIDVKQRGGAVVIQDEPSSVVFGMPGAVFSAGAYDRVASPKEIVEILKQKAESFELGQTEKGRTYVSGIDRR